MKRALVIALVVAATTSIATAQWTIQMPDGFDTGTPGPGKRIPIGTEIPGGPYVDYVKLVFAVEAGQITHLEPRVGTIFSEVPAGNFFDNGFLPYGEGNAACWEVYPLTQVTSAGVLAFVDIDTSDLSLGTYQIWGGLPGADRLEIIAVGKMTSEYYVGTFSVTPEPASLLLLAMPAMLLLRRRH